MAYAGFKVDADTCTGCGLCLDVCPGNMVGGDVLRLVDGRPTMVDQGKFGWKGCWRCQHCLAVCPTASISILGVSPDDVSGKPDPSVAEELSKLMRFRRSCRAFEKDDVDARTIDALIDAVGAVPTGGNNQQLEFTVVASRAAMKRLHDAVFTDPAQESLFELEADDLSALRLYDAPHLFIAHKEMSERFRDGNLTEINLATAYFELLANAYGLGTVISTYAAEQLVRSEAALQMLGIPDTHRFMAVVGFGYPRFKYARGVSKAKKTHRIA